MGLFFGFTKYFLLLFIVYICIGMGLQGLVGGVWGTYLVATFLYSNRKIENITTSSKG